MAGSLKKGLNLRGELGQVLSFNPAEVTYTLLLIPSTLSFPALRIRHSPCGSLCRFWTAKQGTDRLLRNTLAYTHTPFIVLDSIHRNAVNLSKMTLCWLNIYMLTDLKCTDGILPQRLLRVSTHGARGE